MENQNEMHVSVRIDLGTAQGRSILAALSASVNGQAKEPEAVAPAPAKAVTSAPKAEPKAAAPAPAKAAPAVEADEAEEAPKPKAAAPKAAAPKKAAASGAATPKPKTAATSEGDFDSMDPEAQLEAIKSHVTKHTKKGKSADIRQLLSQFGAARASELEAGDYVDFQNALTRYSAGESVEDIFPAVD